MDRRRSLAVQSYLVSARALDRVHLALRSALAGFWMGALSRESLHLLDKVCYDRIATYFTPEWNRRGLFDWERDVIDRHFTECRRLLVGAAGGGREVLALLGLGYDVDGFECHPGFVECANRLLREQGYEKQIEWAARDECPELPGTYDGLIMGWSGYMSIRGRARRIEFLKRLRSRARQGSALLISFRCRSASERRFRMIKGVGNLVRRALRREPVELGDDLAPCYVHYFTRDQIASELTAAGFDLLVYSTRGYGHAVGIAAEPHDREDIGETLLFAPCAAGRSAPEPQVGVQ